MVQKVVLNLLLSSVWRFMHGPQVRQDNIQCLDWEFIKENKKNLELKRGGGKKKRIEKHKLQYRLGKTNGSDGQAHRQIGGEG